MAINEEVMMVLGNFKFAANKAAYQSLRRSSTYKWKAQQRIGSSHAMQFLGQGAGSMTLEGIIYPAEFNSGLHQIEAMRQEAAKGKPLTMIGVLGRKGHLLGKWVIIAIEETNTLFLQGGAPRKIAFSMQLKAYGGGL